MTYSQSVKKVANRQEENFWQFITFIFSLLQYKHLFDIIEISEKEGSAADECAC